MSLSRTRFFEASSDLVRGGATGDELPRLSSFAADDEEGAADAGAAAGLAGAASDGDAAGAALARFFLALLSSTIHTLSLRKTRRSRCSLCSFSLCSSKRRLMSSSLSVGGGGSGSA